MKYPPSCMKKFAEGVGCSLQYGHSGACLHLPKSIVSESLINALLKQKADTVSVEQQLEDAKVAYDDAMETIDRLTTELAKCRKSNDYLTKMFEASEVQKNSYKERVLIVESWIETYSVSVSEPPFVKQCNQCYKYLPIWSKIGSFCDKCWYATLIDHETLYYPAK